MDINILIIQNLIDKYKDNPYILQRINKYINILPTTLETEDINNKYRVHRTQCLFNEQQIFIQVFLNKNQYYYLITNNCFYHYNGKIYKMVTEDDIQYQLLSIISKDRKIMQWKHKTKINVIKQIKDRNLFKSIPESYTIQKIINLLYPNLFSNKNQVKYFLTIIGDTLLKKTNNLIFLVKPRSKEFITILEFVCYCTTGYANIANNFVTKYNEMYNYQNCRLVNISNNTSNESLTETINKNILDILCVATYYSERYGSSDQYIGQEELNYSLYLKNNTQLNIFNKFCDYSFETVGIENSTFYIKWKNMRFIWKLFISKHSLPNVIYINNLKTMLKSRYNYNELNDTFYNVTSKYLPFVSNFKQFWECTITIYNNSDFVYEIEIDELYHLFKKWIHTNSDLYHTINNTNENDILKILNYYFPKIEIIENKYILNIQISLWDKTKDIDDILQSIKNNIEYKNNLAHKNIQILSFDEIYTYYLKHKITKLIISKHYFEKYLYYIFNSTNFIQYTNFISMEWFNVF
jgi:hypothetical protein